jgi:RimJ/RimL family protein N-acetyltransferase
VACDPLIWEQHPSSDRYKEEVFRKFFQGAIDSGGAYVIHDAATGAVIGSTRYYNYDAAARSVYIGYTFLARSHWGGQYNPACKKLMLDHAFRHVDSVFFQIGLNNRRSRIAIERLGAKLVREETVAYVGETAKPNALYEMKRGVNRIDPKH